LAITTSPSKRGRYAGYGTPAGELGEVDVLSYGDEDERSAESEGLDEMHRVFVVKKVFLRWMNSMSVYGYRDSSSEIYERGGKKRKWETRPTDGRRASERAR